MADIIGTPGDDRDTTALVGTEGADTINGLAGYDELIGLGGDDYLYGGTERDDLYGGDGDDRLFGGDGDDWLRYEAGSETYDGGPGFDRAHYLDAPGAVFADLDLGEIVDGGGGIDYVVNVERVTGGASDDTLLGNDGDNSFSGEAGDDLMNGRGGFDYVWYGRSPGAVSVDLQAETATGGEGIDTLISIEGIGGSNYADTIYGSDADEYFNLDQTGDDFTPNSTVGGADTVDGRGGFDIVGFVSNGALAGVTVDLGAGTATDETGNTDTLINVEGADGTDLGDTIRGSDVANSLRGLAGNDTIYGGLGDDTLDGSGGTDEAVFGVNVADATIALDADGNVSVSSSKGDDILIGIETMTFADRTVTTQSLLTQGGTGSDNLFGSSANDTLRGFEGSDLLDGWIGADVLDGGLGNDRYVVGDPDDLIVNEIGFSQSGGIDTVESYISFDLTANLEILRLQGGADLDGSGTAAPEALVGNDGQNVLSGGGGTDQINGKSADDIIVGGAGADTVVGGGGVDTFDFNTLGDSGVGQANRDFINGFVNTVETIDLSDIDANPFLSGDQAFTFIGSATFSGAGQSSAGELRFFTFGGLDVAIVEADWQGDGQADMQIFVNQTNYMTGGDFEL